MIISLRLGRNYSLFSSHAASDVCTLDTVESIGLLSVLYGVSQRNNYLAVGKIKVMEQEEHKCAFCGSVFDSSEKLSKHTDSIHNSAEGILQQPAFHYFNVLMHYPKTISK